MITKTGTILEITAYDPATIETELNRAVEHAQAEAIWQGRYGILVTQLGFTSYAVAISSEVPYGQTHECNFFRGNLVTRELAEFPGGLFAK